MCLAIPGKVLSISGDDPLTRMGKIDFSGVIKQACLAYVPEVQIGDYVIVHVGFALSKVDEDEAQKVFEYLKGNVMRDAWTVTALNCLNLGRFNDSNN